MPIDVASSIKFTATDTEPTSDKGRIYYDDSDSQLKHYDGNSWEKVSRDLTWGITPGYGPYTADDNTSLLIHSDTSDGSTTFTDSSSNNYTITPTNANHATTQAKIGATSMYFDGADYLSINDPEYMNFGAADWTIDFWFRPTSAAASDHLIGHGNDSVAERSVFVALDSSALYTEIYDGSGAKTLSGGTIVDNTWHHYAVSRASGTTRMFLDGVVVDTTTEKTTLNDPTQGSLNLGVIGCRLEDSTYSNHFEGYMDEIRFSKGIARWTSAFTVY